MTEWHPLRSYDNETASDSSRLAWKQLDETALERGRLVANTSPAKMPTMDHSSMADYANVYEPSDDTYLLIDALKYDLFSGYSADENDGEVGEGSEVEIVEKAALEIYHGSAGSNDDNKVVGNDRSGNEQHRTRIILEETIRKEGCEEVQSKKIALRLEQLKRLERIQLVMEIGTGSGVPITYLSKRLKREKPRHPHNGDETETTAGEGFSVVATDLNSLALEFAERTAKENGVVPVGADDGKHECQTPKARIRSVEFVECDLAEPLLERLGGTADVVLFNPPYVPTDDSEICGNGIEISWAGGEDGRRVIDRALPQIAELLRKPDGACYMITVDDNLPCELAAEMEESHGLRMVPLVRRRARNEYLSVQKITWL